MPRAKLIGKTVLIGLTYYEADDSFIEQVQKFGTIRAFDRANGIEVELDGGGTFTLPPDRSALQAAKPGEYRLRSTGQVVTNPDFVCSFSITKPVKH